MITCTDHQALTMLTNSFNLRCVDLILIFFLCPFHTPCARSVVSRDVEYSGRAWGLCADAPGRLGTSLSRSSSHFCLTLRLALSMLQATECHVVIEWPNSLMCPPGAVVEQQEKSRLHNGMTTIFTLLAIAMVGSGILYLIRKTLCWSGVRSRVNRLMGYKHSSLVTYHADPQEEWTEFEALNE
ncbi:hypothetical protein FOCC_FOCC009150 [Frankliniella occidentalis]|nr:hypothetical protein FOCC_FOCC009150 [Frankliniella occidentalis]